MLPCRSLFDAPQAIALPKTFFVPTGSGLPAAERSSRSMTEAPTRRVGNRRAAGPVLSLTSVSSGLGFSKGADIPSLAGCALKAVFRLVQRVILAEAVLLLTVALCLLAGFPAIVTAFFAALVEFLVSMIVALRTLGPLFRKIIQRGQ